MTIPHLDLQIEYLQAVKAGKRMCVLGWPADETAASGIAYEVNHPVTFRESWKYKIREVPRQQYIPECDVPRALEVEPEMGASYWSINPWRENGISQEEYCGKYDKYCFAHQMCFATEADARANWEAMSARRER